MKRIALALAALAIVGGASACSSVNTSSQSYKSGYELGQTDGPGLQGGSDGVDPTTCQAVVNAGLAYQPGSGFNKTDFIAGFMAGCHAAGGK